MTFSEEQINAVLYEFRGDDGKHIRLFTYSEKAMPIEILKLRSVTNLIFEKTPSFGNVDLHEIPLDEPKFCTLREESCDETPASEVSTTQKVKNHWQLPLPSHWEKETP